MNKINVFCFGFGQTAKSLVKKLKFEKIPFKLTATSRQKTQNKNFEDINYESFQFNEKKFDNNLIKNLDEADHILISIAKYVTIAQAPALLNAIKLSMIESSFKIFF